MYVSPTNLPSLTDDPDIRARIVASLSRKKEVMAALQSSLQAPRDNGRLPYLCLGCQVGSGGIRKRLIGLAAYPLLRLAVEEMTGYRLVMQAYHAQSYEAESDAGPGAVIGIQKVSRRLLSPPDTSAATALKMWQWVNAETNFAYVAEEQAATDLWQMAQQRCLAGISYLRGMGTAPDEPQFYPEYLAPDLHALLGVEALRQLVNQHLGLNLVLIDGDRLIAADHLRWSHNSLWSV